MNATTQATTAAPAMTMEQMQAIIDGLKAENKSLKKARTPKPGLKVSEKGALSVYGLGKFPVTLYREQWERLLAMHADIEAFIVANDAHLVRKGE